MMIKIFLVEDEIAIRKGIKNSIDWEKEGYEFVGEAGDGELAYPMILKTKPDILITDIKMPFMDGLQLSKLVRKELPATKILILSGYDEFEYAKEAIKLQVAEYLLKPISSAKLLDVLAQVKEVIRQEQEEKELIKKYREDMKENRELEKERFLESKEKGAPVRVEWSQIGIRRPGFTPPLWTSTVHRRLRRWNRERPWFYPPFFRRLRGWASDRGGAAWYSL